MKLIPKRSEIRAIIQEVKSKGNVKIGFVPTMGFLHKGHLSLIEAAKSECDIVVVSIFINPTQFAPSEDFDQYPRDIETDVIRCHDSGADFIFNPSKEEIYPSNFCTYVNVENLSLPLCGENRPGHFRGVATIVTKLFNIVKPDIAYFGQKDGQQAIIIKRMTEDLDFDIQIRVLPTIREANGLAMSSRNVYLTAEMREKAGQLYAGLLEAERLVKNGETNALKIISAAEKIIKHANVFEIQYIECRYLHNLQKASSIDQPVMLAVAVLINKLRLIDNVILNPV